jgi:hypothetical protein
MLIKSKGLSNIKRLLRTKYNDNNILDYLNYITVLFGNMGNYYNYGDKKFIPRLSKDLFKDMTITINNGTEGYQYIIDQIYDINDNNKIFYAYLFHIIIYCIYFCLIHIR